MSENSAVIVDYGMGNIGSIKNMIEHVGGKAIVSKQQEILQNAPKLILAGVGAFDEGIARLEENGLRQQLETLIIEKRTPLLAICVGMQLLFDRSEEGVRPGLGWIRGAVKRFPNSHNASKLTVPHMGWNSVSQLKQSSLTDQLPQDARFYFVHSFYCECAEETDRLLQTTHGMEFTSAIERGNIYGVQFHPEKSHRFGMTIMKNFLLR